MLRTMGSEYNPRNNAFNLLRFVFASMVISFHSYVLFNGSGDITVSQFLSQYRALSWDAVKHFLLVINGYCGTIAVNGFFVISGFLITQSLLQTKNAFFYLLKRALRIYPALLASLVGSVIIGMFFTKMRLWDYLFKGTESAVNFMGRNFFLLNGIQNNIQDVFSSNKLTGVNGSLWTLPFEVLLYIALLVLFLTRFSLKGLIPLCALVTNVMFVLTNIFNYDVNFWMVNVEYVFFL